MNIYRLSLFFTPVFRWTIPLMNEYTAESITPNSGQCQPLQRNLCLIFPITGWKTGKSAKLVHFPHTLMKKKYSFYCSFDRLLALV
jgi:hypothetical protein